MKLSVSLPDEMVAFLDEYAQSERLTSRSAALVQAVRLLRGSELTPAYDEAFAEWEACADADVWETTIGDGLT